MQFRSSHFLLVVLALTGLALWAFSRADYSYGLDVRGGVRLVYSIDESKLRPEQTLQMEKFKPLIRDRLQQRVEKALAVTEGSVVTKEPNQFVVELPGMKDEEQAKQTLGSSASIKFYWAANLKTSKRNFRDYSNEPNKEDTVEGVQFVDRNSKPVKFGTPEYQKMIDGWQLILQGDDLQSAEPEPYGNNGYRPLMRFTAAGSAKMSKWSREHESQGEFIAAVLDGRVLSCNPLADNTILSDNAIIQGDHSVTWVKWLTDLLNSGSLPVDLKLEASNKLDPTQGQGALKQIVVAGIAAFAVVSTFLIVYYAAPGVIAFLALCLYVLFTLAVMKTIGATFSLAAIAGFILSVGMAVDANILVFERFKEEMKAGKSLQTAIRLGFKRALSAIIDSNASTLLTAMVLVYFGTGPVKGFATTLIIGVAISFFTAFTVTRTLLMFSVDSGLLKDPKWFAVDRQWFKKSLEDSSENPPLQVVNRSKKWFAISLLTIIPGIIFIALGGIRPNVEFQGGVEASFALRDAAQTAPDISGKLEAAGLRGSNVQIMAVGGERQAIVSVPRAVISDPNKAPAQIAAAAGFAATDERGHSDVGPTIQKETITNAIYGVICSSALIIIWLAIRFGFSFGGFIPGLRFGCSAVLALIHDVFVVIGLSAIMGYFLHWEISSLFITAVLTIIAFSVHDTIVIFDRIRENLRRPNKDESFEHLVNKSITQSFARSINTSMTVIVTLLVVVMFGTPTIELKFFNLAMLVGIISGTYSSIYNASPILYLWDKMAIKKKGHEFSLVEMAMAENERARTLATYGDAPQAPAPRPTAPRPSAKPSTPAAPGSTQNVSSDGRTYGQVRRRASDRSKGHVPLDDDDDMP